MSVSWVAIPAQNVFEYRVAVSSRCALQTSYRPPYRAISTNSPTWSAVTRENDWVSPDAATPAVATACWKDESNRKIIVRASAKAKARSLELSAAESVVR